MHVNNVSSYAPPGYKLARTEYEGDRTKHVFCRLDAPSTEIALECVPGDAAEERGHLEKFRELHTPAPEPVVAEEPVTAPAKPLRKRS